VPDNGAFAREFVSALSGRSPQLPTDDDGFINGSALGLFLTSQISQYSDAKQHPTFGKLRDLRYNKGEVIFRVRRRNVDVTSAEGLSRRQISEQFRPEPPEVSKTTNSSKPDTHAVRAQCDIEVHIANERRCLKPKDTFTDCPECPEMVV